MARKKVENPEGCFRCRHASPEAIIGDDEINWILKKCKVFQWLALQKDTNLVNACDENLGVGSGYASRRNDGIQGKGEVSSGAQHHSFGREFD